VIRGSNGRYQARNRSHPNPRKSSPSAPRSLHLQGILSKFSAFVAEILDFFILRAANVQRICCKN